jgi:hypothetical protein
MRTSPNYFGIFIVCVGGMLVIKYSLWKESLHKPCLLQDNKIQHISNTIMFMCIYTFSCVFIGILCQLPLITILFPFNSIVSLLFLFDYMVGVFQYYDHITFIIPLGTSLGTPYYPILSSLGTLQSLIEKSPSMILQHLSSYTCRCYPHVSLCTTLFLLHLLTCFTPLPP